MRTRNANNGNISSIINSVDQDDEVMSHLKWQIHENLNTMFIEYDDSNLVDITYEIITQWEEQHGLDISDQGDGTSAMCHSISYFFHKSQEYDNHAWLTEAIAKRSNGAFVV